MNRLVLVLLLLVSSSADVQSQGRIDTDLREGMKTVRIAVPEFLPDSTNSKLASLATVFNQVLWADLEFAGNLTLVSRSFYPSGRFVGPSDIKQDDWMKPGVDAQVIAYGDVGLTNNGLFEARVRLQDLQLQQRLLEVRYGFEDDEEYARKLAHRVATDILQSLGFGKGVSETRIAYVCGVNAGNGIDRIKEICVMDYDGTNSRKITSIGSQAVTPGWSPDSEKVAFLSFRGDRQNIEIVDVEERRRIPFPPVGGASNFTPTWSPNGRYIAFASGRDDNDGPEIYLADGESNWKLKRLTVTKGSDLSPSWNPKTGLDIVFSSERARPGERVRDGHAQLYIMDIEGTSPRLLEGIDGSAHNPAWSPDGSLIAFSLQRPGSGDFDICLYDLSNHTVKNLTLGVGRNERPSWAPDGKHLVFQSDRSGTTQIYSMLANGLDVRQLTRTGFNEGPAWSGYPKK